MLTVQTVIKRQKIRISPRTSGNGNLWPGGVQWFCVAGMAEVAASDQVKGLLTGSISGRTQAFPRLSGMSYRPRPIYPSQASLKYNIGKNRENVNRFGEILSLPYACE